MRCPKSRFPIWIIVFDELKLIIFVSQGLTLSTASLVDIVMTSSLHYQERGMEIVVYKLRDTVETSIVIQLGYDNRLLILDSLQNLHHSPIVTVESNNRNDASPTKDAICKIMTDSPNPVQDKKNDGRYIKFLWFNYVFYFCIT